MNNPQFTFTKSTLPTASSLSVPTLKHLSKLYDSVLLATPQQKRHKVSPTELQRLDTLRYTTLPNKIAERVKNDGEILNGFLAKPELQDLLEWKLARGVYRPTLPSLIASNSDESVVEITKDAFGHYEAGTPESKVEKIQNTMKKLSELKGVGPATASLLLSVAHPRSVPFFSDELFYWTAATGEKVKLEKIKYNMKEYEQIVKQVDAIQDRLEKENDGERPRADDIERAAYVVQKLQNPDIWEAVVGKSEDAAEAIIKDMQAKEKGDENTAELDEADPPTDARDDLTEVQKEEENEQKKEILVEHGAKVKSTGKSLGKRSRAIDDQLPPRRSTRTRK